MEKLQIPTLPENYLDRDRLYGLLEANTGACFLIGLEGCGKTSVLAKFCREKRASVFWYSFGKEDNQEPYFQSHFPVRLAGADSMDRKRTGGFLCLPGEKEVSCIVLDNLQVLTNRKILCVIRSLLESNTGAQQIFLVMSDRPAPCFSKYMAAGKYRMVTDRELCFTVEELGQLAGLYFQDELDGVDVESYAGQLMQLTGGWPVAVSYLLRYLQNSEVRPEEIMDMQPLDVLLDTMLYDYIDYEIYSRFSMKEKLFLMQAAVFHRFDRGLLRYCLGQGAGGTVPRKFCGGNLLYKAGCQLLIRLFLLEQTTQQQKQKLKQQAAGYYLQKKDFAEAFSYMENDTDGVRRMLLRYGKEIMQKGCFELLGQCLAMLKEAAIDWTPQEMELAAEYYYRLGDREQMEGCLHAADSGKKIKVSAFGTFRAVILSDGKELTWRTKKGCELFAYLLDLNGEAVERKTLLTVLWQDEIPNNAVAMLHNMFYNIRKELSYYHLECMIQYKNRKYVMDTGIIQSDVEQIRAVAGYVEGKNTELLMQNRHLFDTWWGIYLEDMDNIWIRDRQEYYGKIFERGCLMIGAVFMEQESYEKAVPYLKNALDVSCYSEKIMGMLLECYGRSGELSSAKKQYEGFCSLLKKELDIMPGKELQESYRECMGR